MKIFRNPFVRVAFLSLAVSSSVHAVSATWNGTTNGNWSTTTNWSTSPVPTSGDTATFNNAGNTNTTVATGAITVSTILFDIADAAAYTLGGATAGTGTIALNHSGAITVNNSVINSQLINANLVLGENRGAGTYTFTNNSVTSNLILAGTVSGSTVTAGGPAGVKTLDIAGQGSTSIGGAISDGNASSLSLTKTGSGTATLSGASSYSGATTVTTGTLLANNATGSATSTGAVSVGVDGTLGGTGTIAPTGGNGINVSGVLAPGGSVGTGNLTFNLGGTTGTVAMASGSSFEYELGVAGADIDAVGISDLITLAGAGANDFAFNGNIIDFQNTGSVGFYKLFDTSANAATWTGLTVDGTGLITGGLSTSNLATGLSGSLIMGGGTLGGTSGDIYLQVIPEPSAAVLGGIGMLFLLRRRRNGLF